MTLGGSLWAGDIPLLNPIYDFYAQNYLSAHALGAGQTGLAARNHLSDALLNPASISLIDPELIVEYGYKNNLTFHALVEDIELDSVKPIYLIGTGFSFTPSFLLDSRIHTGILFATPQTFHSDYGILSFYDMSRVYLGTSEFYSDLTVYSVMIPVCWEFNEYLSLGVNLNYLNFVNKASVKGAQNTQTEDLDMQKIVFKYGVLYSPVSWLHVGATIEPAYNVNPSTNIPAQFAIGVSSQWEALTWSLDGHYTASHTTDLKDDYGIHTGLQIPLLPYLTIQLGLFTQLDIRTDAFRNRVSIFNPNAAYLDHKLFITNGLTFQFSDLTLDIAYADSIALTEGATKQRYLNMGVGVTF